MHSRTWLAGFLASVLVGVPTSAAALDSLHASCSITSGDHPGTFRLRLEDESCKGDHHCSNFSNDSLSRFSGITLADLARDGAQLNAVLNADAGTFTCAGTVHDGELEGNSTFTPSGAFVDRMSQLGFTGFNTEKLQAYALLDVKSAWVESMKNAKVGGITVDNLIALHIFHVDPAYVAGLTALGYPIPDADQLIGLKVQGVNAEEVRQIRSLGFQPTLDELVQIRIFHITPEFIRQMKSRGFQNLTIAKLVQIKIFKMDE
jgi:hypothetical protein